MLTWSSVDPLLVGYGRSYHIYIYIYIYMRLDRFYVYSKPYEKRPNSECSIYACFRWLIQVWEATKMVLETFKCVWEKKNFRCPKRKLSKFHYRFQGVPLKWLIWNLGEKCQKWLKSRDFQKYPLGKSLWVIRGWELICGKFRMCLKQKKFQVPKSKTDEISLPFSGGGPKMAHLEFRGKMPKIVNVFFF